MSVRLPAHHNGRVRLLPQDFGQLDRQDLPRDLPYQIDGVPNLHYAPFCTWERDSFSPNGMNDPG